MMSTVYRSSETVVTLNPITNVNFLALHTFLLTVYLFFSSSFFACLHSEFIISLSNNNHHLTYKLPNKIICVLHSQLISTSNESHISRNTVTASFLIITALTFKVPYKRFKQIITEKWPKIIHPFHNAVPV